MVSYKKKLIAVLTNHEDDVYGFRREVIENLIQFGYDVLVSCPHGKKIDLLSNLPFKFVDIRIDRRGTNFLKDFILLINYYRMLKKHRPDIVLTYTAKPNIYASMAASWLKIPFLNNVTGFGSVVNKNLLFRKFIMYLFKSAFKKSSCVFFQNKENMDIANKYKIINGEYELIPGSGVNTKRFEIRPYPSDFINIKFIYIGRILEEKGIDDYLNAAKIIKRKYKTVEFHIIGFVESSEKKYIRKLEQLQNENIIIYHGNQIDVRPYIENSNCTIHPSKYGEGISNVLLESAASGRPIITTNISGCKEVVENGINGFLYNVGDLDDLISRIELFLNLEYKQKKQLGINGRKKVEVEFSRDLVVEKYMKRIVNTI